MKLVQQQVGFLNPGQIPVMTVDQPLNAIAKEIKWTHKEFLGDDRFLVMMGPLHIEMKCIGKYTVFERNTIVT